MNGLDDNKFDDILRSKLKGSSLEPPRDLLPNIMGAIDANAAAGGSRSWLGGIVIGFLAISILGYYVYSSFDSNQSRLTAETTVLNGDLKMDAESKSIGNFQVSADSDGGTIKSSKEEEKISKEVIESYDYSKEDHERETFSKDVSDINESSTAKVKSSKVKEVYVVGLQKSYEDTKQVQATEKSVVAKVLSEKIDHSVTEEVLTKTSVVIGAGSTDALPVDQEEIDIVTTESNNIGSNSEQMAAEIEIDTSNSPNDIKQSGDINNSDILLSTNSIVTNTNESILLNDQESSLNLNSTVDSTNETVNISDAATSVSHELNAGSDSENMTDVSGENEPIDQGINESGGTMVNEPLVNEQIIFNGEQTDETEQAKSDFVDSLQTAIQSQVLLDSNLAVDISTLEIEERKWNIDILAGPSMSYRIFNSEGNQELQDHKNSNESSLMTSAYNLELSRVFAKKWKVHIGAMYLRTGEKYAFSDGTNSHEATNQYDYLSIPLGIDFSLFKTGRFEFLTGVGAQYNFLQKGLSSWLDPNDFSAQIHAYDDNVKPFKEQVLAWNAELGFRYRLNDRFDIIVKEQGILFNNIYKTKMGMDQREYSFETLIGLGYRF